MRTWTPAAAAGDAAPAMRAAILAGGAGSRMGGRPGSKAAVELAGRPLASYPDRGRPARGTRSVRRRQGELLASRARLPDRHRARRAAAPARRDRRRPRALRRAAGRHRLRRAARPLRAPHRARPPPRPLRDADPPPAAAARRALHAGPAAAAAGGARRSARRWSRSPSGWAATVCAPRSSAASATPSGCSPTSTRPTTCGGSRPSCGAERLSAAAAPPGRCSRGSRLGRALLADQDVALGPVHLRLPGAIGGEAHDAVELADLAAQSAPRSPSAKPSRAASAAAMSTESRIAPFSASLRSWTIELNCLPRRVESAKQPVARQRVRHIDEREVRPAVGRREVSPRRVVRAAVLERLAALAQLLDPAVERDHRGDLARGSPACRGSAGVGQLGPDPRGELAEHLPLGPRTSPGRVPGISGLRMTRRSVVVSVTPPGTS